MSTHLDHNKVTAAGLLITLGIIFGDIGTSPLYVMRAIMGERVITEELIYGGMSCVFWTLTILTTFKYITLALKADNNGEGGIFALYALVRRQKNAQWLIYPAMIGCACLIADGFLTPSISISSAVEGLRILNPDIPTVPIVLTILVGLFSVQQFGTNAVGKVFGPVMMTWFSMMAVLGAFQVVQNPGIFRALNPMYAFNLLFVYPKGFLLLGSIFLCTTGAEALYSDLGHCGRKNIQVSWSVVKVCLLLNYFGQSAFLLQHVGKPFEGSSVFYAIMPAWFLPYGIAVATVSTVIASQALISGTFTMVNEAMKLRLSPNLRVIYTSQSQGQIYIPVMNWFLMFGCIAVVLFFRESSAMEAAYGLNITMDMLMTTTILRFYLHARRYSITYQVLIIGLFYIVEGAFFFSNLNKFFHGGYFSFTIALVMFLVMYVLHRARQLRAQHTELIPVADQVPVLKALMQDETIPKEATNLVYLTTSDNPTLIDTNIIYSIFKKRPKRADIYWFIHVDISSKPFGTSYAVETIIPKRCFFVKLKFGFKVEHKVNLMFKQIVADMVEKGEVDELSHYPSLRKYNLPADFKFILLNSRVSADNALTQFEMFIVRIYRIIKSISLPTEEDFGLELSNLEIEKVPIAVTKNAHIPMERMHIIK
jgi:KUP system potassium uptake protein